MENCILCGNKIHLDPMTPVEFRTGYIVGSGQLCTKCYIELYLQEETESKVSCSNRKLAMKR